MFVFNLSKPVFSNEDYLLQAIKNGDAKALIYQQDKVKGAARKMLEQRRLPQHILGEILNDASIILLKKTREPDFRLKTAKINTYFLEIIKYLILNKTRERNYSGSSSLDEIQHLADTAVQELIDRKENLELIDGLLNTIGAPCSDIIRLKYLEGYSDEEVVSQKITAYLTVDSLRVKRSGCLKRLREMVHSVR